MGGRDYYCGLCTGDSMSAHLTSVRHIDLIVTAARGLGVISPGEETATGQMLRAENVRNLRNRYGTVGAGDTRLPDPMAYRWRPAPDENLAGVFLALRSYAYQSCDSDDYETTVSAAFVKRLTQAICHRLGTAIVDGLIAVAESATYWYVTEWDDIGGA